MNMLWRPWFAWRPVWAECILSSSLNAVPFSDAASRIGSRIIWGEPVLRRRVEGAWEYRMLMCELTDEHIDERQY